FMIRDRDGKFPDLFEPSSRTRGSTSCSAASSDLASRLAGNGGGAVLQVVRYFNDTDQDQPNTVDAPNLFGWHLDRSVLDFLIATGAELDVDEYDMTGDDENAM
ncbi:hypothetical protein AB4212_08975, partial [Streptomyces sp. 2MCAF27]